MLKKTMACSYELETTEAILINFVICVDRFGEMLYTTIITANLLSLRGWDDRNELDTVCHG